MRAELQGHDGLGALETNELKSRYNEFHDIDEDNCDKNRIPSL
jgi:hypothetical protein